MGIREMRHIILLLLGIRASSEFKCFENRRKCVEFSKNLWARRKSVLDKPSYSASDVVKIKYITTISLIIFYNTQSSLKTRTL